MNVIFTNRGAVPIPLSSTQGKGFVTLLDPGVSYPFDAADVSVVSLGDNPDFLEELASSVKGLLDLIFKWREKAKEVGITHVQVDIENIGPNGLRVLLGSNVEEYIVNEGTTYNAVAPGYIEIRELGV